MRRSTIRWCVYIGLIGSLGCASTQSSKTRPKTNDGIVQAGLVAGLQGLTTPKPGEAKVTFAVFGGSELSDADRLNQSLRSMINEELGTLRSHRHRSSRPFIVTTRTDATLPIDLETLVIAAAHQTTLKAATHVAFVRYSGPRLAEEKHLTTALKMVGALSTRPEHLVIDMSTRTVLNSTEWAAWSESPQWMSEQVLPGIEEGPDGITLFTRGMVKYGLPDLEAYGLTPAQARSFFERFQTILSQLRTQKSVKIGDVIQGVELVTCRRDPRAIEGECVGLSTPE